MPLAPAAAPVLISLETLTALAHLQPVPACAWVVGADLTCQAVAGPLAVLTPGWTRGRHLYEVQGTDSLADPVINAVHRALQGERVSFTCLEHGHHWQVVAVPYGPEHCPRGVLGIGLLLEDAPGDGEPCRYIVTRADAEARVKVGDYVTVLPDAEGQGRCFGMHYLHPDEVTRLLMGDHLRPVTRIAEPKAWHDQMGESDGPPPGARPGRGLLRLEREG